MKYASAAAFRRALETRLLVLSREGGGPLVRLRKSVAFDRLLARLFAVAPDPGIPQLDLTRVSMGDDSGGLTG